MRVVLDLEIGVDPIRGLISGPGADWQPFHGWIELAQALELARHARDDVSVAVAARADVPAT